MSSEEIKDVLDSHQKWINGEDGGKRADLSWTDLREANLSEANLCKADLRRANLSEANLCKADLHDANLRGANLCRANLRGADLRGADFDFSCFPLWCGGSRFKCDTKLVYQILAHICTLDFLDDEGIKELIMPFAQKSHRAQNLGISDKK